MMDLHRSEILQRHDAGQSDHLISVALRIPLDRVRKVLRGDDRKTPRKSRCGLHIRSYADKSREQEDTARRAGGHPSLRELNLLEIRGGRRSTTLESLIGQTGRDQDVD